MFLGVWGCLKHFVHNGSNLPQIKSWAKPSMFAYYYFFSILLDSLYTTECVQCCELGFLGGEGVGGWVFIVGVFFVWLCWVLIFFFTVALCLYF